MRGWRLLPAEVLRQEDIVNGPLRGMVYAVMASLPVWILIVTGILWALH